ncbi:hypothetical protein KKH27_08060 [bacterium]|nr:hypothetical protein [bacterium]MBU1985184.1 hypothetical protein [bacterium]
MKTLSLVVDPERRRVRLERDDNAVEWIMSAAEFDSLLRLLDPARLRDIFTTVQREPPDVSENHEIERPESRGAVLDEPSVLSETVRKVKGVLSGHKLRNHGVDYAVAVVWALSKLDGKGFAKEFEIAECFEAIYEGNSSLRSALHHGRREKLLERSDDGQWRITQHGKTLLSNANLRARIEKRSSRIRNVPASGGQSSIAPELHENESLRRALLEDNGQTFEAFVRAKRLRERNRKNADIIAHFAYFLAKQLGFSEFDENDIYTMYRIVGRQHPEYLRTNIDNHRRFFSIYNKLRNRKYAPNDLLIEVVEQGRNLAKGKKAKRSEDTQRFF